MPIQVLSPDVAAKIAAGEVVERPASVVKELIENAIDAAAQTIRVEIMTGGKQLIKISDDGAGIPNNEVPIAFERHATSKLSAIEDLFTVQTLGFRGEALASIAAVSRLNLISRPASQTSGTQIRFEGGLRQALGPIGAPAGTVIIIENLFYNVPARLKFLKADATETGHINRVVNHYALAYPKIRFSLVSNNRPVFQTDGTGSWHDVIVSVWGLETAKQMMPLQETETGDAEIKVSGYISEPSLHRGQRDQLIFFVNRRWIQDRSLSHAVAQAYHTFLPIGRHPVSVINIDLDPSEVDINVHPTKAEVKFRNFQSVFNAVQGPVRLTLTDNAPLVRPAQVLGRSEEDKGAWSEWFESRWDKSPQASLSGDDLRNFNQLGFEAQRTLDSDGNPAEDFGFVTDQEKQSLPPIRVVGQIQQMYIIAEGPDGLYLVDQHAAHERIQYDKLMAQTAAAATVSQRLLDPLLLNLNPAQAAIVEAERDALTQVGFELEHFGGDSYRLMTIPEIFGQTDPLTAFSDVLGDMTEGAVPLARETHERVAIIVCKRASIKGGQSLSYQEMEALMRQLEQSDNPRTCPHGRPTMIHLSAHQLAREFGRH